MIELTTALVALFIIAAVGVCSEIHDIIDKIYDDKGDTK